MGELIGAGEGKKKLTHEELCKALDFKFDENGTIKFINDIQETATEQLNRAICIGYEKNNIFFFTHSKWIKIEEKREGQTKYCYCYFDDKLLFTVIQTITDQEIKTEIKYE